jgi:hypothetical protein
MRRKLGYFALAVVLMIVVHTLPTPAGIKLGGELLGLFIHP